MKTEAEMAAALDPSPGVKTILNSSVIGSSIPAEMINRPFASWTQESEESADLAPLDSTEISLMSDSKPLISIDSNRSVTVSPEFLWVSSLIADFETVDVRVLSAKEKLIKLLIVIKRFEN